MIKEIEEIRAQIDFCDLILFKVLEERLSLCKKIASYKEINNIQNIAREAQVIEKIIKEHNIKDELVKQIMNLIFTEAKEIQKNEILKKHKKA